MSNFVEKINDLFEKIVQNVEKKLRINKEKAGKKLLRPKFREPHKEKKEAVAAPHLQTHRPFLLRLPACLWRGST